MHVLVVHPLLHLLSCHALDALLRRRVCTGHELDLGAVLSLLRVSEQPGLGSARIHAQHGAGLKLSPHRVNHSSVLVDVLSAVV